MEGGAAAAALVLFNGCDDSSVIFGTHMMSWAHAYQTASEVADRAMSAAKEALLVRGQTPAVLLALSERLLGLLPEVLVGETASRAVGPRGK